MNELRKKWGLPRSGWSPDFYQRPHSSTSVIEKTASNSRLTALDFTKGALVLLMVLYHWLNYFVATEGTFYKYLRFLTPSFIFITGFLISHVYLRKYDVRDPRLVRRLMWRGIKLMIIFVFLNAAAIVVTQTGASVVSGSDFSLADTISIYVDNTITGQQKYFFSILIPIALLLLLSGCMVVIARLYKSIFQLACLASVLSVVVLGMNNVKTGQLELISIGLVGTWLGCKPLDWTESILQHPYALLVAYMGYWLAITLWNEIYLLQIVAVCLSLGIIYTAGSSKMLSVPGSALMLLGRYSLFGYIVQIVILQVLHRVVQGLHVEQGTGLSFVVAVVLTVATVKVMDELRSRVRAVNMLYVAVFS